VALFSAGGQPQKSGRLIAEVGTVVIDNSSACVWTQYSAVVPEVNAGVLTKTIKILPTLTANHTKL